MEFQIGCEKKRAVEDVARQGCGGTRTLIHCWWEYEMAQLPWNSV